MYFIIWHTSGDVGTESAELWQCVFYVSFAQLNCEHLHIQREQLYGVKRSILGKLIENI